jgi:hypothetical protein
MATPALDVPSDFTAFELVEWAETSMILEGKDSMSRTAFAAMFPAGQSPDEAELDEMLAEIRRRADAAPAVYPFRAPGNVIALSPGIDTRIYAFFLILSIESAPFRTESRFNEIGPLLELLTREAMLALFGDGARAVRFGTDADGRPTHLADAVTWLAELMGLEVIAEAIEREIDGSDKDGGIDVAAWRGFADKKPGIATYLVQCTTQMTYERKPADVVPEMWAAWIRFGLPPDIALSIPFAIPPDAKVGERLRYRVNLLLDRPRLCQLLEKRDIPQLDEFEEIRAWNEREIKRIREAAKGTKRPRLAKRRRPTGKR